MKKLIFSVLFVALAFGAQAQRKGEAMALKRVGFITSLSKLFTPFVWLLSAATNAVLRMRGIDPHEEVEQVDEEDIRSIISHGWGLTCNEVKPESNLEKSQFTVDELTGLIGAAALMRPSKSVDDLEVKSVKKKFNDKKFAAKCDREIIKKGCEMLSMEVKEVAAIVIDAMKAHAQELQIGPKE